MNDGICNTPFQGSIIWLITFCAIIFFSVTGNTLTIIAICTSRKLKNLVSNRFILSLAISDLLVGFTIPYHMVGYYWSEMNTNKIRCLLRFSLIGFACASSIYNLLLVSADRYFAIVHPLHYSRYMTRRVSRCAIAGVWIIALCLGCSMLFWNTWSENEKFCNVSLVPSPYFNYFIAPCFVLIWSTMMIFYLKIVREANSHAKRMKSSTSMSNLAGLYEPSKSLQMVFIIIGCVTITWVPYFVCVVLIKASRIWCLLFYEVSFALSASNSALNPLIYAWKNKGFREAFSHLLTCRLPNSVNVDYITNHVPSSKSDSLRTNRCYLNGNIEDLIRSEQKTKVVNMSEFDSELTIESELTTSNSFGSGRF